jgi:DNA-directed RNA polymerase I, II, and III subunit RPABC5
MIPVRCFTCGKVTGNKYESYIKLLRTNHTEEQALNILGLRRFCCRRMIISHVERVDLQLTFNECKQTQEYVKTTTERIVVNTIRAI